jgi:hypothetical protein
MFPPQEALREGHLTIVKLFRPRTPHAHLPGGYHVILSEDTLGALTW